MVRRVVYMMLTFGVAGLAIFMAVKIARDARRAASWLPVSAKVLEKGLGPGVGRGAAVEAHVKYSYSVAGTEYTSERVYLTGRVGQLPDAQRAFLATIPATLTAHYDPAHPGEAFLFPDPVGMWWVIVIAAVVATLAALAQLIMIVAPATPASGS